MRPFPILLARPVLLGVEVRPLARFRLI